MSISIFDIASGISWTEKHKIYFKPEERDPNAFIITEYLNDASPEAITNDINILSELFRVMQTNDKALIDEHIMSKLGGYTEYDDGLYVFVTGFTDLSPSVLYDFHTSTLFLTHPNLSIKNKFFITAPELIGLLRFKESLVQIFP